MNYKNILLVSFAAICLAIPTALFAEDGHGKSVEAVLQTIREEQNVTQNRDINAEQVSDAMLEELGDAVMSLRFPDERQHEWMDSMMGGEGSQSLRAAHISMGYEYLTGGNSNGGGMYGRGMMGLGWDMPMMGGHPNGWGMRSFPGGIWIMVLIVGAAAVIGAIVVFVVARTRRGSAVDEPIQILKTRLAKGEITREEYETLKQDLS